MTGRATGDRWWLAGTAVCALLGGILAIRLAPDLGPYVTTLLVIGSAAAATAVAMLLTAAATPVRSALGSPPGDPWHREQQVPADPNGPAPADPPQRPHEPAEHDRRPEPPKPLGPPSKIVITLPTDRPADPWWTRTRSPDPDTAYDPTSALIAQCPHCGDFRLDVHQDHPAHAFRCRNPRCGHTWTWQPGTPWPPLVVRRKLAGSHAPSVEHQQPGGARFS